MCLSRSPVGISLRHDETHDRAELVRGHSCGHRPGFGPSWVASGQGVGPQVMLCAAFGELSDRFPHRPQASRQQRGIGVSVDQVVTSDNQMGLAIVQLEDMSLEDTLRRVDVRDRADGRSNDASVETDQRPSGPSQFRSVERGMVHSRVGHRASRGGTAGRNPSAGHRQQGRRRRQSGPPAARHESPRSTLVVAGARRPGVRCRCRARTPRGERRRRSPDRRARSGADSE